MSNTTNPFINPSLNGHHTEEGEEPETPIETIVIDPDATIIELTQCRLRTIEGLEGLTKVETLNMRQNLIEKIENISQLTTLKQIDFYDNHIERIEGLDSLIQLKHLDLSFSKLNNFKYFQSLFSPR
jgi:Leucine-rich repeat (LRR) protein